MLALKLTSNANACHLGSEILIALKPISQGEISMSETRYTEDHEWLDMNDGIMTVGITNHAQEQLGDIVSVELPEVGRQVEKGDEVAVIDSVKAASEVYAPADGEIAEVNEALLDDPSLVNSDPQGKGWFFKLSVSSAPDLEALMDAKAYQEFVED